MLRFPQEPAIGSSHDPVPAFQLVPAIQLAVAVSELRFVPSSRKLKVVSPKGMVRLVPPDDGEVENWVFSCLTLTGPTVSSEDQLTEIEQVLLPAAIAQFGAVKVAVGTAQALGTVPEKVPELDD